MAEKVRGGEGSTLCMAPFRVLFTGGHKLCTAWACKLRAADKTCGIATCCTSSHCQVVSTCRRSQTTAFSAGRFMANSWHCRHTNACRASRRDLKQARHSSSAGCASVAGPWHCRQTACSLHHGHASSATAPFASVWPWAPVRTRKPIATDLPTYMQGARELMMLCLCALCRVEGAVFSQHTCPGCCRGRVS